MIKIDRNKNYEGGIKMEVFKYEDSIRGGYKALLAIEKGGKMTMLKGSITASIETKSFKTAESLKPYYRLWIKLKDEGIIVNNEFKKDCEFKSFAEAAAIIRLSSLNVKAETVWEKIF